MFQPVHPMELGVVSHHILIKCISFEMKWLFSALFYSFLFNQALLGELKNSGETLKPRFKGKLLYAAYLNFI